MSNWVQRGFYGDPLPNNGQGPGYQQTITLAAGESEILRLPAGWKPTIYISPDSGGTATVSSTGVKEDDVATTTRWVAYSSFTEADVIYALNEFTALKFEAATETCIFDVVMSKDD